MDQKWADRVKWITPPPPPPPQKKKIKNKTKKTTEVIKLLHLKVHVCPFTLILFIIKKKLPMTDLFINQGIGDNSFFPNDLNTTF